MRGDVAGYDLQKLPSVLEKAVGRSSHKTAGPRRTKETAQEDPQRDRGFKPVKTVSFIVPGPPVAKGRPRFSVRKSQGGGAYVSVRTPDKTVIYENQVKLEYREQTGGHRFDDDCMLEIVIEAYYGIPKSDSKKKRAAMLTGDIRPTKKPDIDNVLKAVADSLNGIAYRDDSQIVRAVVDKFYDTAPRLIVTITEI